MHDVIPEYTSHAEVKQLQQAKAVLVTFLQSKQDVDAVQALCIS